MPIFENYPKSEAVRFEKELKAKEAELLKDRGTLEDRLENETDPETRKSWQEALNGLNAELFNIDRLLEEEIPTLF